MFLVFYLSKAIFSQRRVSEAGLKGGEGGRPWRGEPGWRRPFLGYQDIAVSG